MTISGQHQGSAGSNTSSSFSWKTPDRKNVAVRQNLAKTLRLSPKAYMKLQWFRDRGSTEISGFGISYRQEPLYIVDFLTIKQRAGAASVEFDDDALNAYLDSMVKVGWHPAEVLRIWLHTHPGSSASPSGTDMNTFKDVFGGSDWSIMAILAKGGEFKAKFRHNIVNDGIVGAVFGGGREVDLDVRLDLSPPFDGVSQEEYEAWEEEYQRNVLTRSYTVVSSPGTSQHYHGGSRVHYPGTGYHDYRSGMWEEWAHTQQWDNDGTEGFGKDSKAAADAVAEEELLTRNYVSFRSLLEQEEIPEWGGRYRLKSSEDDETRILVSGSVEQVWQVEEYDRGSIVITDFGWYEYASDVHVRVVEGDDIDCLDDISLVSPDAYGEVTWRFNGKDEYQPLKITRVTEKGIIDLRDDKDMADMELGLYSEAIVKSTSSSGEAGFSEAEKVTVEVDADDKRVEESRRKTDVIHRLGLPEGTTGGDSITAADVGSNDQPGFTGP